MEEIKVMFKPNAVNSWCQIVRARLSEFQGLVRVGRSVQAVELLADIEDALSTLAVLAKEADHD